MNIKDEDSQEDKEEEEEDGEEEDQYGDEEEGSEFQVKAEIAPQPTVNNSEAKPATPSNPNGRVTRSTARKMS